MARDFYADMAIGMTPRNQVSAQQLVDRNLGENFVNSAVGFGKGLYGNKLANDNVANMQGLYDKQIAAARPGSISGGIYGDTSYNADTNTLNYGTNAQTQGMLDSLYNQQAGYANQLANFNKDPMALGQYMYDLKRPAMQQAQDIQTNQALERLQATGMLSSSSGNQLQGSLAQSQMLANQEALAQDMMNAQNIANAIQGRQTASMAGIGGINTAMNQQAQNAINMGVNVAPPTGTSAAYQNQMDVKGKTGGDLADILGMAGNAIAPGIGGFLGKAVGGLFS
jgi:hypothetical protein